MRDCKHGRLARSCEICELQAENKKLREALEEIQDVRVLADSYDALTNARKIAQKALKKEGE